MVTGLPLFHPPKKLCEGCLVGKQPRKVFAKVVPARASKPLEMVYTDVCGPRKPITAGRNRYFVTFVDEYSRMMWLFLVQRKEEVFKVFQKFKGMIEKQPGLSIQTLKSDGGGEYTSKDITDFC